MKKLFIILAAAIAVCSCCNQEQPATSSENQVIDAIMARRSIRKYTDAPVSRDVLQQLAICGINAPNAMNNQDWDVRIIDSKEFMDELTAAMLKEYTDLGQDKPGFKNVLNNATAAFAIASPIEDADGMYLQNVGLMTENICLAAYSLGLGTCVMAWPAMFLNNSEYGKPILDKLGFKDGYKLRVFVGVGYPDEAPEARPRDASKVKFLD